MSKCHNGQTMTKRGSLNKKLDAAGLGLVFHLDRDRFPCGRWLGRRSPWSGHYHPRSTGSPEVFRPEIGGILGYGRIPIYCGRDLEVVPSAGWIYAHPVHYCRVRPSGLYICWQGKKFRITRSMLMG